MSVLSNEKWTFGIVTPYLEIETADDISINNIISVNIIKIIKSIKLQNIPQDKYEIIIIGANNLDQDIELENIHILNFDEKVKENWITKKKNIIFEKAIFENIIVIHDYFIFNENWYKGFQQFDNNWDVCMIKIFNQNGIRWRDWILWWRHPAPYRIIHNDTLLEENRLWYSDNNYTNTDMYISGSVMIGKKEYLIKNKLNEDLCWGQGEDCEWSLRCRENWIYKMNKHSKITMLKQKDQ